MNFFHTDIKKYNYFENFEYVINCKKAIIDTTVKCSTEIEILKVNDNSITFKASNIDFNETYYLIIEDEKIDIIFNNSQEDTYQLEEKKLVHGENILIIEKNKNIKNIDIYVKHSNNKIKNKFHCSDNKVHLIFNVVEEGNYTVIIVDGLKEFKFNIDYNKHLKQDYKVNFDYQKGKLFLNIERLLPIDEEIKIEGDFVRNISAKKSEKIIKLTSSYHVKDYKLFSIKVNGKLFSNIFINKFLFPKNIIKSSDYLKLDKPCQYDLTIYVNQKEYKIPKNTVHLNLDLEGKNVIKVFFKNLMLFEQKISKQQELPNIYFDNGSFKLDNKTKKYVKITLKNKKKPIIFKPNETFKFYETEKGINLIEIDNIENANISHNSFYYIRS